MNNLEAIFAAIQALSPPQRRQLQKHLHAAGLFVAEDLLTDQNRLGIATAVKSDTPKNKPAANTIAAGQTSLFDSSQTSKEQPATATTTPPAASQTHQPTPREEQRPPARTTAPIVPAKAPTAQPTGRVVLGAPQAAAPTPQNMAPLPGRAPESPIQIIFDGGSKGNPGEGYGSYQLRWPGLQPQLIRLQFGNNYTNNEAEYDTLIRALEDVHRRLEQTGAAAKSANVEISGDSQLVIRQVLGEWKCKDPRMAQRRDRVRQLLTPLGKWSIKWHDRSNSVRDLGH